MKTLELPRRERDELVQSHLNLAYSVARRFAGRGEELEDLHQVALLALVHAAERFDPTRDCTFATFAVPTLIGELKRHFRDHGWDIRPPRGLQERYLEVVAVIDRLTGELKRLPTTEEIAARGGWSERQVEEARAQETWRHLDRWEGDDEADHRPGTIDVNFERVESRDLIEGLLTRLDDREREIVRLRFAFDLDQADIGRRVGLSQTHISRLLEHSIRTARSMANS